MKIFGAGMCKTGTVSLGRAFETLGYRHYHGSYHTGNRMLASYLSGDYGPIYDIVEGHDTFEDFPFCTPEVVEALAEKYPDSKFVLTLREPGSWYLSLSRYFPDNLARFRSRDDLPLGPFYGFINYMLSVFGTVRIKADKDLIIAGYQQYNEKIKEMFEDKPDRLLSVCWMDGDGWKELCGFLDKPLPAMRRFPHENINVGHGLS